MSNTGPKGSNGNKGSLVWVKVQVPEGLHWDLRTLAFQRKMDLRSLVVSALEKERDANLGKVEGPKKIEVAVPPRVVSVPVAAVRDQSLSMKRCVKCSEETAAWVMAKDGKVLCQDCAQDLRVANA